MKIAVFYENIYDGARAAGLEMEAVLSRLREKGMEMLYISADSWKRDRRELKPMMARLGLETEGMHGFCDFPRLGDNAPYREMIDLAADSGARNFLIVPGMLCTGNSIRDLDCMVRGVRRAAEYGAAAGMPVLMEDFDGLSAPYNCMAGLRYFLDAVPELGVAFDTGNFILFREDELAAFDMFADRIQTLHLKDRTASPRHEKDIPLLCADLVPTYACAPGSGDIRIAEIIGRLKARQYAGNVIAELYCCDPRAVLEDIAWSVGWLREQIKA